MSALEFQMEQFHDPDGAVHLTLSGELDLAVVDRLELRLAQLQASSARVRLDLSRLCFIDSTGLRAILLARQRAGRGGWELEVERNVAPAVGRVFALARVEPFIWQRRD